MTKEEKIETIVEFILQKDNEKIAVVESNEDCQLFTKDFQADGQVHTKSGLIALHDAQRELYANIADALINNKKRRYL